MKTKKKTLKLPSIVLAKTKPIRANITLESTMGTPAIAGMIAHLFIEAGATVVLRDSRISIPSKKPNLKGLEINLGRLVWIREEEADKWDKE